MTIMSNMEQIVEREIDQLGVWYKEEIIESKKKGLPIYDGNKTRVDLVRDYLNNFHLKLPDNNDKSGYGSWYRELSSKRWDIKNNEYLRDVRTYSELYLSQSPKEFYGAVDLAVDECGISRDEITTMLEGSNEGRPKEIALPIFIKLREMGYKKVDLAG